VLLLLLLQGTTNFLSSFANCPYTSLLPVDDTSRQPNAWSNATIPCTFSFIGNLGSASGGWLKQCICRLFTQTLQQNAWSDATICVHSVSLGTWDLRQVGN
jgi:hypothetical protein